MSKVTLILALLFSFQHLQAKEYLVKYDNTAQALEIINLKKKSKLIRQDVFLVDLADQQVEQLQKHPSILLIEPNHKLKTLLRPNDLQNSQWNLANSNGFDINALAAWDISIGSRDTVVAVIDTGVNINHSDLKANLWVNELEAAGMPNVDDDGNGYVDDIHGYHFANNNGNPMDTRGHGTHVAGIIGAVGDNNSGVVGMAWKVSLMALNMFPTYFSATVADAIRAIDYAVANGAHIINASWGQEDENDDPEFKLLYEAIERAQKAGVLFVAAAGNSNKNNDNTAMVPATFNLSNIIAVGAIDSYGQLASYSNYGKASVDVLAPGSNIISTGATRSLVYKSGTSMSAPHITGLAALMLSVNPNLKPSEIKNILRASCTPHRQLQRHSQCGGYVDAAKALSQL